MIMVPQCQSKQVIYAFLIITDYCSYTIGILLTVLMLLVFFAIGLLVAGLALTTGEYKKHTENRKLLTRLKYGVITLQM